MTTVALVARRLYGRARSGPVDFGPRAGFRQHLIVTDPHTGPAERALCGARAVFGWVMLPVGLEDCPRCVRADQADPEHLLPPRVADADTDPSRG